MKRLLPLLTFFMCGWLPVSGQTGGQSSTDNTPAPYTFTNNNQLNNSLSGNGTKAYSVDLYTGTANVNIPIYNYSVDGVDAGISLSYNTSGIKVDQLASDVGLGWALNAGASITRQVNGVEDEATLPMIGYKNFSSVIPQLAGAWAFRGTPEKENDVFTINFGNRSVDFILKFPDIPGDLNAGNPGNVPIIIGASNNANITVSVLVDGLDVTSDIGAQEQYTDNTFRFDTMMETNPNVNVMSFKVVDEVGNTYYFERGDYEYKQYIDTTFGVPIVHMYYPGDKWVLTELDTWRGHSIYYKYRHYNSMNYPIQQEYIIKESREYQDFNNHYVAPFTQLLKSSLVTWNGSMSQLAEIDYPNGVVAHFDSASQERLDLIGDHWLDDITLEARDNGHVDNKLQYKFNYTYFDTDPNNPEQTDPYADQDQLNYRLKLNSIYRYGTDLSTGEPYYTFAYNTTAQLPARCISPGVDVYGYYNGKTPAFPIINPVFGQASGVGTGLNVPAPLHTFSYTYNSQNFSVTYGIDKTDDINYSQAAVLTGMTNGLGGTTAFSYQANQLSNPPADSVSSNGTLTGPHYYAAPGSVIEYPPSNNPSLNMEYTNVNDGLCLASITDSDGYNSDNTIITKYSFANGMRFFTGGYYWYPTVTSIGIANSANPYKLDPGGTTNSVEDDWKERIYTNALVSSQDNINGANHGYSDAKVYSYGHNGELVSSRHTRFTNVISQAGEFDVITRNKPGYPTGNLLKPSPVNTSRILESCGLFVHTVPRYFMEKHLMGLPVEIDDYDPAGNLTHKTVNVYSESINDYDAPANAIRDYYPMRLFSIVGTYNSGSGGITLYWPYIPFSAATAVLSNSTNYDYSYSSGVTQTMSTTKTYLYDEMDNLGQIYWPDSKGNLAATFYGYSYIGADKSRVKTGVSQQINNLRISGTGLGFSNNNIPYAITSVNKWRINNANIQGFWDYTTYTGFDGQGNVLETWYQGKNKYNSAIWDNRIGQKIASVTNAQYADIAYTSFEGGFLSGLDPNKGNWSFDSSKVMFDTAAKPITGKYDYSLSGQDAITNVKPLTAGKGYYVSFWVYGTAPNVYVYHGGGIPSQVTMTAQYQVNAWVLYTGYVTGGGGQLSVAYNYVFNQGSQPYSCKLDELRLYPADASMETFTYEPLLGVSSHCDDRNNVTYQEYDVQGRPTVVRDLNRNIISVTKQVNQNNDN